MSKTVNALNNNTVNTATSGKTANGTKILKSTDNSMDKNAFLKILAAQLSNLDPTQNQDSSAYVSQMAQFASMEQMTNLNTTMSDSAHQEMIGKTVITSEKNTSGEYLQGYVTQVIKKSGGTYLEVLTNGKIKEVAAENIIGAISTTDTNSIASNRSALNSDFLAASELAAGKKNVVLEEIDTNGKTTYIKGKASGAYIDTVKGATVKIKVDVLGTDGKSTTKTYDYGDIFKAGDLTDEEVNTAISEAEAVVTKTATEKAAAIAKAAAEAKAAEEKAAAEKAAADAKTAATGA